MRLRERSRARWLAIKEAARVGSRDYEAAEAARRDAERTRQAAAWREGYQAGGAGLAPDANPYGPAEDGRAFFYGRDVDLDDDGRWDDDGGRQ